MRNKMGKPRRFFTKKACFSVAILSTVYAVILLVVMGTHWQPHVKGVSQAFHGGNKSRVFEQQFHTDKSLASTSEITIANSQTTLESTTTDSITTTSTVASASSALIESTTTTNPALSTSYALLPCNWTTDTFVRPTRLTAGLICSQLHLPQRTVLQSSILFQQVQADVTPSVTSLNDTSCLELVIKNNCTHPPLRVPQVVHYVQFGNNTMSLEHFISILSATKFLQPCLIVIHGDMLLSGPYWEATLSLVHNVVHVRHERPTKIFGHKLNRLAHSADVARLRILQKYGGIYMDCDQFALRGLQEFLNESMVISKEIDGINCGNGYLLAEPGAPFLQHWLDNYTDFNNGQWAVHSTVRPYLLSKDFPHLVRVIHSFFKPHYREVRKFFDRKKTPTYDWTKQHGFHTYHKVAKNLYERQRIDLQDNVIGEAVRYILYGDKDACMKRG